MSFDRFQMLLKHSRMNQNVLEKPLTFRKLPRHSKSFHSKQCIKTVLNLFLWYC